MTTPTQVQIEAAAKVIAYELNLTHSDIAPHIDRAAKAALTAAAEVPPQDKDIRTLPSYYNGYKRGFGVAVERCAQVVDDVADKELDAAQAALLRRIAAAIRALLNDSK